MRSKLPADRVFVDDARKINDAWLEVQKTLEPLLKYITPENITLLQAALEAAQDPSAVVETVNAFSSVSAFNDTIATDGGVIEALEAEDDLSILVSGTGSIASDKVNRSLSLALSSYSAVIPGLSANLVSVSFGPADSGTVTANRIYATPILIPSRRTITLFSWYKNDPGAGGSGTYAINLYYDAGSTPGVIAIDGGQGTATRAVGTNGLQTLTVSQELRGGLYWAMWTADSNYGVFSEVNNAGAYSQGTDSSFNKIVGWYRDATFPGMLSDETASVWTANTSRNHPIVTLT